ncbi:hypothetical protein BDV93DRAFT_512245 [Ceratobasidium sp. AG-I]|nr:hypothetical protein BDV93DRAFT_512245 [Ceratobasidium sp. AG-I]
MNSNTSTHASLARRIGLPQVSRPGNESELTLVAITEAPQLHPDIDSAPPFSPAGSLFDGSDEETDGVPKLALGDVSDAASNQLTAPSSTTLYTSILNAALQRSPPIAEAQPEVPYHSTCLIPLLNEENAEPKVRGEDQAHTDACITHQAQLAIAATLEGLEGVDSSVAIHSHPPCICLTAPEDNPQIVSSLAPKDVQNSYVGTWKDDYRVVQVSRHPVASTRPAIVSLASARSSTSSRVISTTQVTVNRARRIAYAQSGHNALLHDQSMSTPGAPGSTIQPGSSGHVHQTMPGSTAGIVRAASLPAPGGQLAQSYGTPIPRSRVAQLVQGRPTAGLVRTVSAMSNAKAQTQVQAQRIVHPSRAPSQAPMHPAAVKVPSSAPTPAHPAYSQTHTHIPSGANGRPNALAHQVDVAISCLPAQAVAHTRIAPTSSFTHLISARPMQPHAQPVSPAQPASQPLPEPCPSIKAVTAGPVSVPIPVPRSAPTPAPASVCPATTSTSKPNQILTPAQLSKIALANPPTLPQPAPYEHVAPAWLMLGPMPMPPPDRNKGMVGGKPIQLTPRASGESTNSEARAPVSALAPHPVPVGPRRVQGRPIPVPTRPYQAQAPAQSVRASFVQAARVPVVPPPQALHTQPAHFQRAQSPPVQRPQTQVQPPRGHFTYTQAPSHTQRSVPRTIPAPPTRTTSMMAAPLPVTDVDGSFSVAAWTGVAQPVARAQSFHGYPHTGTIQSAYRAGAQSYAPPTMTVGRGHIPIAVSSSNLKHRIDDEIQEIPPPHDDKRFRRH